MPTLALQFVRDYARYGERKALEAYEMSNWVHTMAPWDTLLHLTFAWEASLDSARRVFEKWMRTEYGRVSYFYAIEENPSRDGYHVHALWADARSVFRKEAWAAWFKSYGRARIEPVRGKEDVATYCAKYVCKERAWWNVKLQWHRVQALNGSPFALVVPPSGPPTFATHQAIEERSGEGASESKPTTLKASGHSRDSMLSLELQVAAGVKFPLANGQEVL
jgi:hypothetical protein